MFWKLTLVLFAAATAASAAQFVVGSAETSVKAPFSACWGIEAYRYQGLVLKTDAIPAGTITRWEWYAAPGTGSTRHSLLSNFSVKMCHTSLNALTTPFATNYDNNTPVTVFSANPARVDPENNTWFGFDFDKPFVYNGGDNLLVETWWDGGNDGGPNCWMKYVLTSSRACIASRVRGVPQNGYPNGGKVEGYNMYMRITMGGAVAGSSSLGRVKALYR
jgi:hypothetical protein